MPNLRRLFGVLVMAAGVIGLLLSLAGLAGVFILKPRVEAGVTSILESSLASLDTSRKAMTISGEALEAAVQSLEALTSTLDTSLVALKDAQPVVSNTSALLGRTLPVAMDSATDSLKTAESAAISMENAIRSFEKFQTIMGSTPILKAFISAPTQKYDPDIPLADSLGEISSSIKDIPDTFRDLSKNLDKADDNIKIIRVNVETMSESVSVISKNLGEYQILIDESQATMENTQTLLSNIQYNLPNIFNTTMIVLLLFFFWLLMAQIVIFSQGWELYHGTAGNMAGKQSESATLKEDKAAE
jgi:hypothetical protein